MFAHDDCSESDGGVGVGGEVAEGGRTAEDKGLWLQCLPAGGICRNEDEGGSTYMLCPVLGDDAAGQGEGGGGGARTGCMTAVVGCTAEEEVGGEGDATGG